MPKRRLSGWEKALVLLLAGWGLITILPDFARVFSDYKKIEIEVDNNGQIYSGQVPTVKWVDRNCTPLQFLVAVFGGMGGVQYVRPGLEAVTLCVYKKQNGIRSASSERTYPAKLAPLDFWARATLALDELLGAFFIVGAACLVWYSPNAVTWGFFLYAIWFNPGQYYVSYAELQRWPRLLLVQELLQSVAQAVGYCGFVVFALQFPDRKIAPYWSRWKQALPIVGVVLFVFQIWSFLTVFGFQTELVTRILYGLGMAVDVLVVAILLKRRRRLGAAEGRQVDFQKTQWVLWACVLGLSAFLFADSNTSTTFWTWLWTPSEATINTIYLLDAVIPVVVFYAIRHYRVVDMKFALSRKFMRPMLWFIIGILVVHLHSKIEHELGLFWERFFKDAQFLGYVVAFTLASITFVTLKFLIDRGHEKLVEWGDHFFFREFLHALETLRAGAAQLSQAETVEEIDRQLIDVPANAFALASAVLYRKQGDTGKFRRVPHARWPDGALDELPDELSSNHHWVEKILARGSKNILRVDRDPSLASRIRDELAIPCVAIGVLNHNELIGVALYGAHRQGSELNGDEISILDEYVRTAGAAYPHASWYERLLRVYESVRARLEKLEARLASARP
jgi:hypothetical protein